MPVRLCCHVGKACRLVRSCTTDLQAPLRIFGSRRNTRPQSRQIAGLARYIPKADRVPVLYTLHQRGLEVYPCRTELFDRRFQITVRYYTPTPPASKLSQLPTHYIKRVEIFAEISFLYNLLYENENMKDAGPACLSHDPISQTSQKNVY
jgi:hypothetical protein